MEEQKEAEPSLMDKAEKLAKIMEENNKKAEELLRRQEELFTRQALSGRSEAGIKPKEITEEEKIEEAAKRLMGAIK